jgi:hypothetical protein
MTGVEAISNAVPLFKKPEVSKTQATLTIIVVVLARIPAGYQLSRAGI